MTDIDKIKAALEPFAISIKDHVPDNHTIETVAWTAGQHRAACEALELLSAHASRVAELEGALRPFLDLRHQSGAHGVISKKLDDMQPLTVTVTKAQFRAAFEALGRENGEG